MDLLKKEFIIQWNAWKLQFGTGNTPDPCNAKGHYQTFVRNKTTKLVKQGQIITYQPKTFENLSIVHKKISYYTISKILI